MLRATYPTDDGENVVPEPLVKEVPVDGRGKKSGVMARRLMFGRAIPQWLLIEYSTLTTILRR
jgi:hypothetical protein